MFIVLITVAMSFLAPILTAEDPRPAQRQVVQRVPRSPQEPPRYFGPPVTFRPTESAAPPMFTPSTYTGSVTFSSTDRNFRPFSPITTEAPFVSPFAPVPIGPPRPLRTVFEWRELEFLFPNETARSAAIADLSYIRGNSVPIDIHVHYGRTGITRHFVTVPRFNIGRPMTLTTVVTNSRPGPGGPFLRPYPDYSWHINPAACNGMVSIYRIAIDNCDRLWAIDSGRIGPNQLCPPQLLVFDLRTDRLIQRHRFAPSLYRQTSVFVNLIPDVRDSQCRDTFVYIGDVQGFGLIVYDHARNASWRIDNKLFYPFPSSGTHRIAGEQFELMDGILGMSLGPIIGSDRFLYFQSLSSLTENRVSTSLIRNSTLFERNTRASPLSFQVYTGRRSTQSVASAIDSSGTMYFGLNEELSVACWHTSLAYGASNIQTIAQDNTTLQFASGVKIIVNPREQNREELWLNTNRFQKYMTGTLENGSVNFRVLVGDARRLVSGTVCDVVPGITPAGAPEDPIFVPVISVPDQVNYFS